MTDVRLVDQLFDGDGMPLVRHLVEDRGINASELDELRALIDRFKTWWWDFGGFIRQFGGLRDNYPFKLNCFVMKASSKHSAASRRSTPEDC